MELSGWAAIAFSALVNLGTFAFFAGSMTRQVSQQAKTIEQLDFKVDKLLLQGAAHDQRAVDSSEKIRELVRRAEQHEKIGIELRLAVMRLEEHSGIRRATT